MINSQDTLKLLELSDNVKKAFLTWDSYVGSKTKKKALLQKWLEAIQALERANKNQG